MARQVSARTTTDHEEIRRWVEERGGHPARVRRTGGGDDVGVLRIDFPGGRGDDTLEVIEWDDFFAKFDEEELAFLHQDSTSSGEQSYFNKLVAREKESRTAQRTKGSRQTQQQSKG